MPTGGARLHKFRQSLMREQGQPTTRYARPWAGSYSGRAGVSLQHAGVSACFPASGQWSCDACSPVQVIAPGQSGQSGQSGRSFEACEARYANVPPARTRRVAAPLRMNFFMAWILLRPVRVGTVYAECEDGRLRDVLAS